MADTLLCSRIMPFGPARKLRVRGTVSRAGRDSTREHGFSLIDVLMVVALIGIVAAIAVPVTGNAVAGQKFKNDAQAVTNMVGLAKMRASATYSRARVRANITARTFALERWDKTAGQWVAEGVSTRLSNGVTFSFGAIAAAPPNTQAALGFSPACRSGITAASGAIANTACIVFNSRGLPVDGGGLAFGGHALYLTDGIGVAATTVTATPRIRRWWTPGRLGTAYWREQQ
jgi:prepilin-type N-terminal cleavage/methylation domain-containing protein